MIREIKGDLWALYDKGHRIVITTNIGWSLPDKINNMGAGVALQAAYRYPKLPAWYGRTCARLGAHTPVLVYPRDESIILFPVKPLLDRDNPERSWDQVASLELIERGLRQLMALPGQIALSTPGAGNGKLPEDVVANLVRRVLNTDPSPRRFVMVQWRQPRTGGLLATRRLLSEYDRIMSRPPPPPPLEQPELVHWIRGADTLCGRKPLAEGALALVIEDVTCPRCRSALDTMVADGLPLADP